MGEIAAQWVSIYPKFSGDFASSIRTQVTKATGGAFGPVEKQSKESGSRSGRTFGDQFRSVLAPILTATVGVKLLQLVRESVDAYSQLEDAAAAASVTFGAAMDKIESKAASAGRTLGMSKQEYTDGAITMGTFGKSAGLAGDDLATFSNRLVQTAGDMASFRGTTPEQAIEAVGAALRGEMEPIRTYGVLLDDATLRQQALSMGLIKTTKDALTPQQRVLAAQAAILKQTTDAQGDFARTSDSTANVQKTLAAESANLSAEIGEKLAPAIVEAQKAGIDMIEWAVANKDVLIPLAEATVTVAAGITGIIVASKAVAALQSARAVLDGLHISLDRLSVSGPRAAIGLTKIEKGAKLAAAAMAALAVANVAGQSIQQGMDQGAASTEEYADMLLTLSKRSGQFTEAQKKAWADLGSYMKTVDGWPVTKWVWDTSAGLVGMKGYTAEVTAEFGKLDAAYQALGADKSAAPMRSITEALREQGISNERILDLMPATYAAFQDQAHALDVTGLSAQEYVDWMGGKVPSSVAVAKASQDGLTASVKSSTISMKDYLDAIDKTYQSQLQLSGSQIGLESAIDAAASSVKQNGQTLDIHTEKGRANRQALDGIASSALAVAQSMKDAGRSDEEIQRQMGKSRAAFIAAAASMGMGSKKAAELATKLGLIKSKKVMVAVDVAWIGGLSKQISVDGTGAGKITLRASGGAVPGVALHDRDDKVPILATPDEWLIQRRATRYYGDDAMEAINQMRVPRSALAGYASGGSPAGAGAGNAGADAYQIAEALADVLQARSVSWLAVSDQVTAFQALAKEMA